jgi:hypothetical protein
MLKHLDYKIKYLSEKKIKMNSRILQEVEDQGLDFVYLTPWLRIDTQTFSKTDKKFLYIILFKSYEIKLLLLI